MSGLVERTCQVRVTETPEGPATFYGKPWNDIDYAIYEDSADCEMREIFDLYQKSVACGLPAFDYVDFRDERIWMCAKHLAKHEGDR
jgi:hypothetical protein